MAGKTLKLGSRLRYPITIVEILQPAGASIKKQDSLMRYSFKWIKTVGDTINNETWEEEITTTVDWNSPAEGELKKWHVQKGDVITCDQAVLVIKEACSHEIQFQGLCAMCGKDVTEANWAAETSDIARAPINMVHDNTNLTVSEAKAKEAEQASQLRLLEQRKLILVVDIDQTIIQACIDPTIGDWQKDLNNPNHDAVKDIASFQLDNDIRNLTSSCVFYIKLRPGLRDFLDKIKDIYELHVYTMGTRAYALNVAKIVDPDQKLFGNRIISRDENGTMVTKNLQRLFPTNTNMVVIIDDRADVWPRNRNNLIKVLPYDFFKGIGDINSSFLPKRADLLNDSLADEPMENKTAAKKDSKDGGKEDAKTEIDEAAVVARSDALKRQLDEQEKTLEKQIKDRPLLHMQERLDKEDEEAEKVIESQDSNSTRSSTPRVRHHILVDSDHELECLEKHLAKTHETFYNKFKRTGSIPDVGNVLNGLKGGVLCGTRIVLSGIVPMEQDVNRSDIGTQLTSFGADLRLSINSAVTHLVVNSKRPRTKKVQMAAHHPHIKIVNQGWLAECLTQWAKVDETPYVLVIHPGDRSMMTGPESVLHSAETTDAEGAGDDNDENSRSLELRLGGPRAVRITEFDENADGEEEVDAKFDPSCLPPELMDGELSPVESLKNFNWNSVDAELEEFLGSDADDDDDEDKPANEDQDGMIDPPYVSESEDNETPASNKKRKYDDEAELELALNGGENAMFISKKVWNTKGASLVRTQYRVDADDAKSNSGLPTPYLTPGDNGVTGDGDGDFDFDEDELEKELMAELENEEGGN